MNDAVETEFKRLSGLLLERGFASKFVYRDVPYRTSEFEFTQDGLALRKLLKKLFDVPNTKFDDLTSESIADLIMIILLTPETMYN
jgi:hypothetical protein